MYNMYTYLIIRRPPCYNYDEIEEAINKSEWAKDSFWTCRAYHQQFVTWNSNSVPCLATCIFMLLESKKRVWPFNLEIVPRLSLVRVLKFYGMPVLLVIGMSAHVYYRQLLVRHYKVYYPVRHHLQAHIISSIQRLGFTANVSLLLYHYYIYYYVPQNSLIQSGCTRCIWGFLVHHFRLPW